MTAVARIQPNDAAERRITDLYIKAVDQLGSDKAAVRLGGLYALERLATTTPDQQGNIGDVMCAYLRMPYTSPPMLAADATDDDRKEHNRLTQELETRQTALEILLRHSEKARPETCRWHDLTIRFRRANLAGANLIGANLVGADLTDADLTHAGLTHANLTRASLVVAKLRNARLNQATLANADLTRADLAHAYLDRARFTHAKLIAADLTKANLTRADLVGADLTDADLTGANSVGRLGGGRPHQRIYQRRPA